MFKLWRSNAWKNGAWSVSDNKDNKSVYTIVDSKGQTVGTLVMIK